MIGLKPQVVEVLKVLRGIWSEDELVVIGAAALGCVLDMTWRGTEDLDVTVAARIEEYRDSLDGLPGWTPHGAIEHRWVSPTGVNVDVLPGAPDLVAEGRIDFPGSGLQFGTAGIRMAFSHGIRHGLGGGQFVRVAPLPALLVMKMASYLDRPTERRRDLQDIAYILDCLVGPDSPERWSPEIIELQLDYDDVSAFVAGRMLLERVDDSDRAVVLGFLARATNEEDSAATLHHMAHSGPPAWRTRDEVPAERVAAFQRGFGLEGTTDTRRER